MIGIYFKFLYARHSILTTMQLNYILVYDCAGVTVLGIKELNIHTVYGITVQLYRLYHRRNSTAK